MRHSVRGTAGATAGQIRTGRKCVAKQSSRASALERVRNDGNGSSKGRKPGMAETGRGSSTATKGEAARGKVRARGAAEADRRGHAQARSERRAWTTGVSAFAELGWESVRALTASGGQWAQATTTTSLSRRGPADLSARYFDAQAQPWHEVTRLACGEAPQQHQRNKS